MTRYYVSVKDGIVLHKPLPISDDPTESPNTEWGTDQMKLNGYVEVSLDYDQIAETIDLENPTVSQDAVSYEKIKFSDATILKTCRNQRWEQLQRQADNIILSKYPMQTMLYVALNVVENAKMHQDLSMVLESLMQAKDELDKLQTRQEIEAYIHSFPII